MIFMSKHLFKANIQGKRFGHWRVLKPGPTKQCGKKVWLCKCDCEIKKNVWQDNLLSGASTCCYTCSYKARIKEMIGKQFGNWTVVRLYKKQGHGNLWWICRCKCGKTQPIHGGNLRAGTSTDKCKKCRDTETDLTGKIFGAWIILGRDLHKQSYWSAKCTRCNKTFSRQGSSLLRGGSRQCQRCAGLDKRTDGLRDMPKRERKILHAVWTNMLRRCFDPKNNGFNEYGLLGITVHSDWRSVKFGGTPGGFERWYTYMGPKPHEPRIQNSRINHNGNYEPGNVKWAKDDGGRKTTLLAASDDEIRQEFYRRKLNKRVYL